MGSEDGIGEGTPGCEHDSCGCVGGLPDPVMFTAVGSALMTFKRILSTALAYGGADIELPVEPYEDSLAPNP